MASCATGCCAADETCRAGTNPTFCGTGGNDCIACGQHEICPAGTCECDTGFTDCGGQCVNLNNDDDHCGSCDNACVGTATCQAGACAAGGIYTFVREWDGGGAGLEFNHPLGIAVDGAGNVYVTDEAENRVFRFTGNGAFIDAWSSIGNTPIGIAVNRSTGEIYVGNESSNTIQTFASDTTPGISWNTLSSPEGVAVNQNTGEVYVTINGTDAGVQRFQSDGVLIENWLAPDPEYPFVDPFGVGIAPNGDVYVADNGTCEILRFTADGVPQPGWSCNDPIEFNNPFGVAVDTASDVYVCDSGNQRILKVTADGGLIGQIGDDTNFEFPVGVAVSLAGYVYVVDGGNANVQQFEPA